MCEVVIVYLYGSDTFIGLLSLALNHNATFAVVEHWDAHLGIASHDVGIVLYTYTPPSKKHWVDSRICILRASG